jgi:hypothetical protein
MWACVVLAVAWLVYDETRNSGDTLDLPAEPPASRHETVRSPAQLSPTVDQPQSTDDTSPKS